MRSQKPFPSRDWLITIFMIAANGAKKMPMRRAPQKIAWIVTETKRRSHIRTPSLKTE